ncbi:MAG TPA: hypothetical protein VHV30_04935 [Polyangiaceae bacterium]|nr:hypothetical protein [Polyangiaceae bacterium]
MAACSKTTSTPDGFVDALVGGGSDCSTFGAETSFMTIGGTENLTAPTTQPSGTGAVSIQCTVAPSGSNFDLEVGAQGQGGTEITLTGTVSKSGGMVRMTISSDTKGVSFLDTACMLTFEYANSPITQTSQELNPGEIWGHLKCTNAVEQGGIKDDNGDPVTCNADVDFLFNNCEDGSSN